MHMQDCMLRELSFKVLENFGQAEHAVASHCCSSVNRMQNKDEAQVQGVAELLRVAELVWGEPGGGGPEEEER